MKVLIVDDQALNRKLLRVTLQAQGHATIEAGDGLEALELLEREPIDAVISDILMPRMDGYRLCFEVRRRERLKNLPFVVYSSSYTSAADEQRALQYGADKFIKKPSPIAFIIDSLEEAASAARPRRVSPIELTAGLDVMKEYSEVLVHKLEDVNAELQSTREQLLQINLELFSRTEQLEAANQELEAFSHTVSHDLKTPLRSIGGFSRLLLQDCGGELDATGKDYLRRILDSVQRMDQLIDDLLELSRITHCDLIREPVDLSTIVLAIIEKLRHSHPERQVETAIARGLIAQGDASLLQIVLENLLSNAWKFSSKNEHARIEFGTQRQGNRLCYFVRDNGAGFDAKRVSKLFGAFQRLHTQTDFPGIGIGLAIVKRIVLRHGGTVWAEGAVGKGASFYFTLEGKQD